MASLLRFLATATALVGPTVYAHSYAPACSTQQAHSEPSIFVSSISPFAVNIQNGQQTVHNSAILAGNTNDSAAAISASRSGAFDGGQISASIISSQVAKITINSTSKFVGARFSAAASDIFYGVWEYPWSTTLDNNGVEFDLKGLGNSEGINWDNARAPFFLTSAGYGVYADTLTMGSFNFSEPGVAQFIFNSSSKQTDRGIIGQLLRRLLISVIS